MRGTNTLVINGKVYDAVTGLPVAAPDPVPALVSEKPTVIVPTPQPIISAQSRTPHHAKQAHRSTQKSVTLRRDVLKKPVSKAQVGSARRKPNASVPRSEHIQRFAPHPQPLKAPQAKPASVRLDITPVRKKQAPTPPSTIVSQKHNLVSKPVAQAATPKPALKSRSLKEQLIAERLAAVETSPSTTKQPKKKRGLFSKQPKAASLITASFAIMLFGGYLTYLNMPGLSVRVAAAQADVAASFPDYHPDGYRFNGPVAYAPGQVAINFVANGGNTKYTVTEQKSTWDSQAVYDNIVAKAANDNYVTNSQQGLTIYTFGGNAAWVNKGILYTINGDAPLSNEQLLHIAASL